MYYRHETCGRLSRVFGECEECLREDLAKFWTASPLPCGHDNTGIPFNKSHIGICDKCEADWRDKKLSRDEEAKKAIIKKMMFNKYARKQ